MVFFLFQWDIVISYCDPIPFRISSLTEIVAAFDLDVLRQKTVSLENEDFRDGFWYTLQSLLGYSEPGLWCSQTKSSIYGYLVADRLVSPMTGGLRVLICIPT